MTTTEQKEAIEIFERRKDEYRGKPHRALLALLELYAGRVELQRYRMEDYAEDYSILGLIREEIFSRMEDEPNRRVFGARGKVDLWK